MLPAFDFAFGLNWD